MSTAVSVSREDGKKMKSKVKLTQQENVSGDKGSAAQGFGRITSEVPPAFDPAEDSDAGYRFFAENGFLVLSDCLDHSEIAHLNEFYQRSQAERPAVWGLGDKRKPHHRGQGLIFSQPLLDHPELDRYTQHPRSYRMVSRLLGGEDRVRFSEFKIACRIHQTA